MELTDKDTIQVMVRVRPLSQSEMEHAEPSCIRMQENVKYNFF